MSNDLYEAWVIAVKANLKHQNDIKLAQDRWSDLFFKDVKNEEELELAADDYHRLQRKWEDFDIMENDAYQALRRSIKLTED